MELRGFEPRIFSLRKCADATSPCGSGVARVASSDRGERRFGRGGNRGSTHSYSQARYCWRFPGLTNRPVPAGPWTWDVRQSETRPGRPGRPGPRTPKPSCGHALAHGGRVSKVLHTAQKGRASGPPANRPDGACPALLTIAHAGVSTRHETAIRSDERACRSGPYMPVGRYPCRVTNAGLAGRLTGRPPMPPQATSPDASPDRAQQVPYRAPNREGSPGGSYRTVEHACPC